MSKADTVWVDVEVVVVRDTAIKVKSLDDGSECWLPIAGIIDMEDDLQAGVANVLELRTVLAEEKGLA
jgi:hypothetical protein